MKDILEQTLRITPRSHADYNEPADASFSESGNCELVATSAADEEKTKRA